MEFVCLQFEFRQTFRLGTESCSPLTFKRLFGGTFRLYFQNLTSQTRGVRGSVLVKALCYKPEGRGFLYPIR
jgi:hypothetical protein